MQIVIPMSGLGQRFLDAGYSDPKPLIQVDGRPIIDWVLDIFPGEFDILFICRESHLESTNLASTLRKIAPSSKIKSISGHKKGPVYALYTAMDMIDLEQPVMVSYCDYFMQWDWRKFKENLSKRGADGAIPCYTGFHPHLLPVDNKYASCKVDQENYLIEIKEKHNFNSDRLKDLHSPGAYYFKSGNLLKEYSKKLMDSNQDIRGEYYVSLIYNFMVNDGKKIWVPQNVEYFCQWGTPNDLKDYCFWTSCLKGAT